MIISASLFSCKDDYDEYVDSLIKNGIKLLHIDFIEGNTPKEKINMLQYLRTDVVFDVHLIKKQIEECDIVFFNGLNTNYLCYQYENLETTNIDLLMQFKGKKGLAFTMDTEYEVILQYVDKVDYILIMCTIPGVSGQTFNNLNIDRIKNLRRDCPNMEIHVDGGIEEEKSVLMSHLNVDLVVSGSYLASAKNFQLAERICRIKYSNVSVKAKEIMLPLEILTCVEENDGFEKIVYALDNDKTSTVVVCKGDKTIGIITDGDVRRTILKYKEQSFSLKAADIVNTNPITVDEDYLVTNLIYDKLLMSKKIRAVPCVKNTNIVGIIDLGEIT